MGHTERIKQLLEQHPGLKAHQIASELGLDRSHVAAALHQLTGGEFIQDSAYRWWPKTRELPEYSNLAPGSFLARLCRYYLECLTRESGSGISIPAAAHGSDYAGLDELPFAQRGLTSPDSDRAIKKILRKVRQERGQIALYIGYAVRLRPVRMAN